MAFPQTFNDNTAQRTAFYILLANDSELFNLMDDASLGASEWLPNSWTPTYLGSTSLSVPGDQTAQYLAGRAVRAHLDSGYVQALVVSASYDAETGITTVVLDRAALDDSLDAVNLGILSPDGALPCLIHGEHAVQTAYFARSFA